jgi:hypothetical protein
MMNTPQFNDWHKSTRSDSGGCVEMSASDDRHKVGVRDTKDRSAGMLVVSNDDWHVFLGEAKAGSFNL